MNKLALVLALIATTGCVSRVQIANIEAVGGDYFAPGSTTKSLLAKGLAVGNGYLTAADQVSTGLDGASVFTILLAAGAAVALVNGASNESLLKAGIAGVATNQVVGYYSPDEAKDALTRAANRQFCIVSEASPYSALNNSAVNSIVARGFNSVRIALRSDLDRDYRSYSSLFGEFTTSVERDGNQQNISAVNGAPQITIGEFKKSILDCVVLN